MKKIFLFLALIFINKTSFSQNKEAAEKIVEEGIPYHDRGNYDKAIRKYNAALEVDKDNLLALSEKAYTLLMSKNYDEAIYTCKKAIEKHPKDLGLKSVYITYGTAFDALRNTERSIKAYEEGIKAFPDFYQLYFNKGVVYSDVEKYDDALLSFQQSIAINPDHANSHNGIARIEKLKNRKIPAILAYCRFLIIEPQTDRALENLGSLKKLMSAETKQTGKEITTQNPPSNTDESNDNKFVIAELSLKKETLYDTDSKNKSKSEVENFIRKFDKICTSLEQTKQDNNGFYWDYYVRYFIDMKKNNNLEAFSYIIYASIEHENDDVARLLKRNTKKIEKFYEWAKAYKWNNE